MNELENEKQNPVAADVIGQDQPGETGGAEGKPWIKE